MSFKKQIFKQNILKKLLSDENSCVTLVPTSRLLALPPFFLNDLKSGILYLLNNMLKKYDRSLGGIIIGYQNIKVLMDENTGIIPIGTSETEVNISVEFYIFQPKIGSFLEGIINKKSNNHIGCLVHRYFNATILKPEEEDYDDWICKDFNVDDKIIFQVKDLDFTGLLPYIEGIVTDKDVVKKVDVNGDCDINELGVNKSIQNEVSCTEELDASLMNDKSDINPKTKKKKNKNEGDDTLCSDNVNADVAEEIKSFKSKKKKKKKDKEDCDFYENSEKERYKNEEEVETNTPKEESLNQDDSIVKKHKKKKKKKEKEIRNGEEELKEPENVQKESDEKVECQTPVIKRIELEDEDSDSFVKTIKTSSKKEKKKKKEKDRDSLAPSQCLSSKPPEDNIFYSTLLEPTLAEKMRISFLSPISSKTVEKCSTQPAQTTELETEKEKKKKHKKRKHEEKESEDTPKRIKTSQEPVLKVESIMEEMLKEQLDRVKEAMSVSDVEVPKKKKKKKDKHKEKGNGESTQSFKTTVNGTDEAKSLIDELQLKEMERVRNELSMSDKDSIDSRKKKKSKKTKEKSKSDSPSVQKLIDEMLNKQINRVKEELNMSDHKEPTKTNENVKTNLYEKLLEDAKSAIKQPTPILKKKKDEDLSDVSTSSKKKNSKKETKVDLKNGSMYNVVDTPEKGDFDKSLFSDSEQSHASPVKKKEEVNGRKESLVQNMMNEFFKDEKKRLKLEEEKTTTEKKAKKRRKSESKSTESLYEKLLRDARSLIDIRDSSPPRKKAKKSDD